MLFCGNSGERLKPMGVMGRPPLNRPFLHRLGNGIRNPRLQFRSLYDGFSQLLINTFRQTFPHHRIIKHIRAEDLGHIYLFAHE